MSRLEQPAIRFDLAEASGSLGDLGTFVPLVVSLVAVCHLDAGSVLLFAGAYNVLTGYLFNQPVPVQPMKAIAAVAVAEGLAPESIAAAGLATGAVVLALGVSGWVETIQRLVPRAIVRGIQLGVGLKLLSKGVAMIGSTPVLALDGWLTAAAAAGFVLVYAGSRRVPSALVIFLVGLGVLLATAPYPGTAAGLGWAGPVLTVPSAAHWRDGILLGALPQVPLTLFNSVLAVCALSEDLFPGRGISTRAMAGSVGLMNLVGCWFGAMPMCHGSGGLAGQYRFGGRTGGCVILLGLAKITLALALGSSAAVLLAAYPASMLGVLLCFAGAELALPARDCTERDDFFLAVATAGGTLAVNTSAGVAIGALAAVFLSRTRENST